MGLLNSLATRHMCVFIFIKMTFKLQLLGHVSHFKDSTATSASWLLSGTVQRENSWSFQRASPYWIVKGFMMPSESCSVLFPSTLFYYRLTLVHLSYTTLQEWLMVFPNSYRQPHCPCTRNAPANRVTFFLHRFLFGFPGILCGDFPLNCLLGSRKLGTGRWHKGL